MALRFKKLTLLCFTLLFSIQLHAQREFSISGSVKSKSTLSVIPGAQLFLNGSTIGTLADGDGKFVLSGIPEGTHEIVVQNLGYESASRIINTANLDSEYSFFLNEKVYNLDEITVKPNTQDWLYNFQQFQKEFIGVGPFSKNTEIVNEEVVNFNFEIEERTLNAYAFERIEIVNKDLGYRIFFYLEDFKIDYKNGTTFFYGQTLFEEMTSKRKRTLKKWSENRKKAYMGSFTHFTSSLIDQNVSENGFVIKGEKRESKARYVSKDTVDHKLVFSKIDSTYYEFRFINFLNVSYKNEYEDMTYLYSIAKLHDSSPRLLPDYQNSSVTLLSDSVLVDKSGFILNPTSILFDGYWGFEKLSDMLPLTYKISEKFKK